jgi:hypothetical protein
MTSPRGIPPEARRAAWDALWRLLLAPHPGDDPGPSDPDGAKPLTRADPEVPR